MKLLLSFLLLTNFNSFAADKTKAGQDKGNGGDHCENYMRNIANDLESWLTKNEFRGLKLPDSISLAEYQSNMLDAVKNSVLSCTTNKLYVGSAEKTCKNFLDQKGTSQIVCNVNRF